MQPTIVPAAPNVLIIALEYSSDGASSARLTDHQCLSWLVDPGVAYPSPSKPVVAGGLPAPAPDTAPVLSPQWAKVIGSGPMVEVPDLKWRGNADAFFTWLATNNGATRKLEKAIGLNAALYNSFDSWARNNPDLVKSAEDGVVLDFAA
jgi:hypothetical protein